MRELGGTQGGLREGGGVGGPPDAFTAGGEDWGLPPYFWERMEANDFAWLRRRARYTGSLYDRLKEILPRGHCYPVIYGCTAWNPERYANRRAEIWDMLREWVEDPAGVSCPDRDDFPGDVCAPIRGKGATRYDSSITDLNDPCLTCGIVAGRGTTPGGGATGGESALDPAVCPARLTLSS